MDDYRDLVHRIRNPRNEVTIAVVGKYIEHRDAYKSIYESLDHAGFASATQVNVKRIEAEELERQGPEILLKGVDGLLVPGGFGMRGI
jgi:CTP synthase